jgi:hypothetical protein
VPGDLGGPAACLPTRTAGAPAVHGRLPHDPVEDGLQRPLPSPALVPGPQRRRDGREQLLLEGQDVPAVELCAPRGLPAVDGVEELAPGVGPATDCLVEQRQRELRRASGPLDHACALGDAGLDALHTPEVQHDPVARVVRALADVAVRERLDDLGGGLEELRLTYPRRERAHPPVVRDPPGGPAQLTQEPLHGIDLGGDGLQVGQRARRRGSGVVDADDRRDVVEVVASEKACLEEAPVPRGGRSREEQHQHVALGQTVTDLPVPVGPGRQVRPGHEALDHRAEPFECLLERHGQRVVLVLVAHEDVEAVVGQSRHWFPPAPAPARRAVAVG